MLFTQTVLGTLMGLHAILQSKYRTPLIKAHIFLFMSASQATLTQSCKSASLMWESKTRQAPTECMATSAVGCHVSQQQEPQPKHETNTWTKTD